jgi:methylmalonyl-CoA/ethylmalonyl-CoA epimerase
MSTGPQVPDDLLLAVDHVGVAVPDLEVAIAFYTGVLGLELVHREVNRDQGVVEAMLAPPNSPDGAAQLQLLAPLGEDSSIARFIGRSGPGLQQIAYRVRDVDAAAAEFRRRGLRLLYAAGQRGTRGSRVNFVHPKDTGGVLVELVQVVPGPGARSG